jgi:hypothetical protein
MNEQAEHTAGIRKEQRRRIAEGYFDALRKKDYSAIPYDDNVTLRAPLAPGVVNNPLKGKNSLYTEWWIPLEPALERVEIKVIDHYLNESLSAICTEAEIKINAVDPPVTLRVADRFTVNAEDKIIEQENHFDPRDVTNPGWRKGS